MTGQCESCGEYSDIENKCICGRLIALAARVKELETSVEFHKEQFRAKALRNGENCIERDTLAVRVKELEADVAANDEHFHDLNQQMGDAGYPTMDLPADGLCHLIEERDQLKAANAAMTSAAQELVNLTGTRILSHAKHIMVQQARLKLRDSIQAAAILETQTKE